MKSLGTIRDFVYKMLLATCDWHYYRTLLYIVFHDIYL